MSFDPSIFEERPKLKLSIRKPSEIRAMQFSADDKYLPNGIFAKGQPFGIVGPAGVGKSRLMLQLLVCIITGKDFLGWKVKKHPGKWLIIQTENGSQRLQADLDAMAAWIGEKAFALVDESLLLHTLENEHDGFLSLTDKSSGELIHDAIVDAECIGVVFDPLNAFTSKSLNDDGNMLATCRGLHKLATMRKPDRATIILHHSLAGKAGMKKALGPDKGSYGKGSKAFTQWLRGQLNIAAASDDGSDIVVACGKNSNGPDFEPFGIMLNPVSMVYEVNPHFDLEAWKESVGVETMEKQPKLDGDAVAELTGPLPIPRAEITKRVMDEWNVKKSRAYKVIKQAITSGKIVWDGRDGFHAAELE